MNRFRHLALVFTLICSVTSSWGSHLGRDLNEADTKLNEIYQQVMKGLPHDAARERFKAAQRAWITWRDSEVALAKSLYEDGQTGAFMLLGLTQQRIKQLEAIQKRSTAYGYEE